jgi:hypothetical protein
MHNGVHLTGFRQSYFIVKPNFDNVMSPVTSCYITYRGASLNLPHKRLWCLKNKATFTDKCTFLKPSKIYEDETHLFLQWPRAPFDTEKWRLWLPPLEWTMVWASWFCSRQPPRSALAVLKQLSRCQWGVIFEVPVNVCTSLNITRHC